MCTVVVLDYTVMQLKLNSEEPRSTKKIHMKKALQENKNSKEQGNAERLKRIIPCAIKCKFGGTRAFHWLLIRAL